MTRKTKRKQIWQWLHVCKLWCHCHFSNLLPIWSNPEAGLWTHINSNLFYLTKTENRTKKSLTQFSHFEQRLYFLSKGYIFVKKCWFFAKIADISKLKRALYWKVCFRKLHMCVYVRTKFQVSSIILTSFREGEFYHPPPPHPPPPQNGPLRSPSGLGLKAYFWYLNTLFYTVTE